MNGQINTSKGTLSNHTITKTGDKLTSKQYCQQPTENLEREFLRPLTLSRNQTKNQLKRCTTCDSRCSSLGRKPAATQCFLASYLTVVKLKGAPSTQVTPRSSNQAAASLFLLLLSLFQTVPQNRTVPQDNFHLPKSLSNNSLTLLLYNFPPSCQFLKSSISILLMSTQ